MLISKQAVSSLIISSLLSNYYVAHCHTLVQTFNGEEGDVEVRANHEYMGHGISISGDAMTIAVGIYGGEPNGIHSEGHVNIYKKMNSMWSFFQSVSGNSGQAYEYFGASVDLSYNGTILAALSCTPAALRVWELNTNLTSYIEIGPTIYMNANWGEEDAITVAVSPNGAVIGALAPNLLNARIFERIGNEFLQKGTDISGFSHSMSLNYDGSTVVVGSNAHVGVFKWNGNLWELMGDYVNSYAGLGDRGCVSITYDGMIVAIGSRSGNGRVGVYNWNGNNWDQKGDDLVGSAGNDFSITDLSSDGNILVVGDHGSQGYVYTFQWDGSNYVQFGQIIQGEGGEFGYTLSLSSDASTLVIGAWLLRNPSNFIEGKTYVYDLDLPPAPPSIMPSLPPTSTQIGGAALAYEIVFGPDPHNQWHIQFDGSAANSEIILYFDITKENTTPSTFKQSVMSGEDCEIDQSSENQLDIKVFTNITPGTSNSLMNSVETRVDINTATITDNQDFYNTLDDTNGKMAVISFCIRSDFGLVEYFGSDGQITTGSITYSILKITTTIDLEFGFDTASISINEMDAVAAEQSADIVTSIDACACDESTHICDGDSAEPKSYSQNDLLSICVTDTTGNGAGIITGFKDVFMSQDLIRIRVVDDVGKPSAFASMSKLNEGTAVVTSRIVSVFFDSESSVVTMEGSAIIGFTTGRRKLLADVAYDENVFRKMQDNVELSSSTGSFNVNVKLSEDEIIDDESTGNSCWIGTIASVIVAIMGIIPLV